MNDEKEEINWLEKIYHLPSEIRNDKLIQLDAKLLKLTIKRVVGDRKDIEEILEIFRSVSKIDRINIYKDADTKLKETLSKLYNDIKQLYFDLFDKNKLIHSACSIIEKEVYSSLINSKPVNCGVILFRLQVIEKNWIYNAEDKEEITKIINHIESQKRAFVSGASILIKLGKLNLIDSLNFWDSLKKN